MAMMGLASLAILPMAGQTPNTQKPSPATAPAAGLQVGKLSAGDRAFIHEAAVGGMAEVELGRLATEKATNPDVKQFGQRMVDDHGKANEELKTLASQNGVTLPTTLEPAHKVTLDRLSKLAGASFDRAYMQDMVKDHDKDVAAFKRASTTAADPDLKAWAGKTLPTLEEHQKLAKSVSAKVSAAGKGDL